MTSESLTTPACTPTPPQTRSTSYSKHPSYASRIETLAIVEINLADCPYVEATLGLINNELRSKGHRGELNCCLVSRYSPGSAMRVPDPDDFDTCSRSPTGIMTLGGNRNLYLTARTSNKVMSNKVDGTVRLQNGSLAFITDHALRTFHHTIQAPSYTDNLDGGLQLVFIERTLKSPTRHTSLETPLRTECLEELKKEQPFINLELCNAVILAKVTKTKMVEAELKAMNAKTDGSAEVKRKRLWDILAERIKNRQHIPESLTRHIVTALAPISVTREATRLGVHPDSDTPITIPDLRMRLLTAIAPNSTIKTKRTRSSSMTLPYPPKVEEVKQTPNPSHASNNALTHRTENSKEDIKTTKTPKIPEATNREKCPKKKSPNLQHLQP